MSSSTPSISEAEKKPKVPEGDGGSGSRPKENKQDGAKTTSVKKEETSSEMSSATENCLLEMEPQQGQEAMQPKKGGGDAQDPIPPHAHLRDPLANFDYWLGDREFNSQTFATYLLFAFQRLVNLRFKKPKPRRIEALIDVLVSNARLEDNGNKEAGDQNLDEKVKELDRYMHAFLDWYGELFSNQAYVINEIMPRVVVDSLLKYMLFVVKCIRQRDEKAPAITNEWTIKISDIMCTKPGR